jgi:hypothetical protein
MNTRSDAAGEQSVTNLAAIAGRWKIEPGRATFEVPETPQLPFGICVSDVRFFEGDARVTVNLANEQAEGRILLGYRSLEEDDYFTVGLRGHGRAYTISNFTPGIGWRALAGVGSPKNLRIGQPINVCVKVRGQQIWLEVDGVRVLEHVLPAPLPYGQLGLFAWSEKGGVEFTELSVKRLPGKAFVVMQFSGFEELYTDVIEPTAKEFGLQPYRADQVYGPGSVLEDIIQGIETAQIVIAEITPANENVFYEVGYAHALKKPTILLADKKDRQKLPFDLSGFRVLFYENSIGGKRKVQEGLEKHLQAILL